MYCWEPLSPAYGIIRGWFLDPEELQARLWAETPTCQITGEDPLTIQLTAPARAIAPGQAAVLYVGAEVIGGGWIRRVLD